MNKPGSFTTKEMRWSELCTYLPTCVSRYLITFSTGYHRNTSSWFQNCFGMANIDGSVLECQATLEYMDKGRSNVAGRVAFKSAVLKLIRNEFRELFLQIQGDNGKRTLRYPLKSVDIRKKFMSEGKAAIVFHEELCTLLISNAPPSQLFNFMKLMVVKVMKADDAPKNIRAKMLSSKQPGVDDISPLTDKEIEKAKMKAMGPEDKTPTGVTKSFKRPNSEGQEVKAKKNCLMKIAEQELCSEQMEVLQAAKGGRSIFFTGSAGTGKSHLLRSIIAALPPDVTFATASTGVAACHIGGTTLHQFGGIGTGEGTLEHCIKLASRPNARSVWRRCKHLIIDEISMVHADFFDKLEHVARVVRNNSYPFGGIQLILCGDFFQLPPVSNDVKFCFQSQAWEKCIQLSFELVKIHRQSDPVLIDILQSIRIGRVTPEISDKLMTTSSQNIEKEGILATRLCTHTADAAATNAAKLEELEGETKVFTAIDNPMSMSAAIDKLSPVAIKITLKIGAQVMLMKNLNISKGLVNGARGVVVKFEKDGLPVVKFNGTLLKVQQEKFLSKTASGAVLSRIQVPLGLAWAFSIHKSQGLTLDCVEMSLSRVFAAGHAYVALSRVKNMQSLRVVDFKASHVWANKDVLLYYQKFRRKMQAMRLMPLGKKKS